MFNLNKFCKKTIILLLVVIGSILSVLMMDGYVYIELMKLNHITGSWLLVALSFCIMLYHLVMFRLLFLLNGDIQTYQNELTYELIKK